MKIEQTEKLIESEGISEEEVQRILETAKTAQCAGGLAAFKGERRGAILAAFSLMENHPKLDFSQAMTIAWHFLKGQRSAECELKGEILEELEREAKEVANVEVNHPVRLNNR